MVSKNPPPDERVVYLALKNVFKGQNAEVRQNKAVRKLIKQHRSQEDVADLIREHNFEVVCNAARMLLCDEIFESTLKAKIRFPELFDLSPAQSAEREVSEAEAARHEADAIEHAVQGRSDSLRTTISEKEQQDRLTRQYILLNTIADRLTICRDRGASQSARGCEAVIDQSKGPGGYGPTLTQCRPGAAALPSLSALQESAPSFGALATSTGGGLLRLWAAYDA